MFAIEFVFLCLVIAAYVLVPRKFKKDDMRPADWGWSIIFALLLIGIGIYDIAGLVNASLMERVALSAALTTGSIVSLWHNNIRNKLSELHKPAPQILEALMLLLGAYLTFVCIELPSNPRIDSFWIEGMILEIAIILLVMVALHFLTQRSGVGATIAALIFEFAGIAEFFVVTFKNTPIMAGDILALGTAAAVGGGYTYAINGKVLLSVALLALVILMLSLTPKPKHTKKLAAVGANLLVSAATCLVLGLGCTQISFGNTFNIVYNAWIPLESYWREGFISSFLTQLQSFNPEKPKGYSNESAEKLFANYVAQYDATLGATAEHKAAVKQFNEEKPSVICIMNESYSDLSRYANLGGAYNGPEWFKNYQGALAKGALYVAPYGGGTCNSEWELMTSCSMAFMGSGVYPYMVYNMEGVPNMAASFKKLGYDTIAMHPNLATNWGRDVVYPTFGFDCFLDINDFTGADRLRNMVTDEATYDKIYESLTTNKNPQFFLNVTMQNHGGYETGALPTDMVKHYRVHGINNPALDEYLALIDESDRAIEKFLEQLSKLDRKVVVVFFGDHQPSIANEYNKLITDDPSDLVHQERERTTEYMIWTNYDVAGAKKNQQLDTSTNFLAADMLQLIGGPLTDLNKAELVMRHSDMPVLNLLGYQDKSGTWNDISTKAAQKAGTPAAQLRLDLQSLQYKQLFGDGVKFRTGAGHEGTVWGRIGG